MSLEVGGGAPEGTVVTVSSLRKLVQEVGKDTYENLNYDDPDPDPEEEFDDNFGLPLDDFPIDD